MVQSLRKLIWPFSRREAEDEPPEHGANVGDDSPGEPEPEKKTDPGRQALLDEDWSTAARIWSKRTLEDPRNARNHRHYVRSLIRMDRLHEAAAACDIARRHHPKDVEFLHRRLWLLDRLGIEDAFRKELRMSGVAEMIAASGRMSLVVGRHFWRRGKLEPARQYFLAALDDPDTRSKAEIHMARLEYRAGHLDQAQKRWSALIDHEHQTGRPEEPYLFLGRIALKSGDPEAADGYFLQAEALEPSTARRIEKWMPNRRFDDMSGADTDPPGDEFQTFEVLAASLSDTADIAIDDAPVPETTAEPVTPTEDPPPPPAEVNDSEPGSPVESVDALLTKAQEHLDQNQLAAAMDLALEAMALDEKSYRACEIAGFAANRSSDWKVSVKAWGRLADIQPFRIGPLFQAASASEQLGDRSAALAFAERVLQIEPANETALAMCARQYARSDDPEGLRSFAERVERLELEELPDRLVITIADGFSAYRDHREAAAWIDRAMSQGEVSADVKLRKARLLYASGDFEESASLWRELLRAPENVVRPFEPHVFIARAAIRMGDIGEAISHFQEASRLNPQHLESRDGLITALLRDGDLQTADEANNRFRTDFPEASRPLVLHLVIGYRYADPEEVSRRYASVVADCNGDLDAMIAIGRAVDGQQDVLRGLDHWKSLRDHHPDNVDVLNRLLIRQSTAGGQDREAKETALALLKHAPDHENGLLQLATLNQRLGDPAEAERLFRRGMRAFPANIGFWIGYANALMRADKVAEGQSLLAQARSYADEADPVALADLARLAELTDMFDEAETLFLAALERAPTNPQLWRRAVRFNMTRGAYGKAWDLAVKGRVVDRRDSVITEALAASATALHALHPHWHSRDDDSYRGAMIPDDLFPHIANNDWPRPAASDGKSRRGAMLITSTLGSGGSERQVMFSMQALSRVTNGYDDIHLVARSLNPDHAHDFFLPMVEQAGFPVIDLAARAPMDFVRDLGTSVIPHREAVRIAASMPPEILAMALPLVGEFLKHRPEVVHTWQDTVNIAGGIAALLAGVPRIVMGTRSTRPDARRRMRRYLEPGYHAMLALPNVIMVNNSRNGARDYEDWLGLEPGSVGVIHNGFDVEEIRAAAERETEGDTPSSLGIPDDAQVIGGVMRFSEEKRPELFVDAAIALAPRLPETHFLLIGEGPLRVELQDKVAAAGLSGRIHMPGAKRPVEPWMKRMSILVLTSRMEGLPNVLIEAQILGVPVAATKVGGVPETMIENQTGIMVDSGDPQVLAEHLYPMASAHDRLREMGYAAKAWAEQSFSLEGMIRTTLEFYKLPEDTGG